MEKFIDDDLGKALSDKSDSDSNDEKESDNESNE